MVAKWHTRRNDVVFDGVVAILLTIFGAMALYPLIYVLSASISDPTAVNSGQVVLLPVGIQFEGYAMVFQSEWILLGYRNSLIYTIAGAATHVMVVFMAAFALSRPSLYGKKALTVVMALPMWFGGGLIPTYIVVRSLGLINTPLVLIVMGAFSMYNCIICRTFIKSNIPEEMLEAAKIDNCSDFGLIFRLVLPLSGPVLAVIALFSSLGFWNDYFSAMIYLSDRNLQTLQLFLREILIQQKQITTVYTGNIEQIMRKSEMAQVMKYSLIIIASLPMLLIYPFLQRFFVNGVMIGSIKG